MKIKNSCWILCTPRTGSTYLCELLNNINVFPSFDHPEIRNKNKTKLMEYGQSFNEWCRLYNNFYEFLDHYPLYSKMIYHQYLEVINSVSNEEKQKLGWYARYKDNIFLTKEHGDFVKNNILPDIKFIHLKRDILSQAVSIYFGRYTKKYHIYDDSELNQYLSQDVEVIEDKFLEAYKDAVFFDYCWDDFLTNQDVLNIDYNDLLDNPFNIIEKILKFLDIDIVFQLPKIERIKKMTRPDSAEKLRLLNEIVASNLM